MRPTIYEYNNYRTYLGDLSEYFRNTTTDKLSFSRFTRLAGFVSPIALKRVITGERNLSPERAQKMARTLGLSGDEEKYFILMVLFDQAKTDYEIELYREQLDRLKPAPVVQIAA